jgi:hypothetical protein
VNKFWQWLLGQQQSVSTSNQLKSDNAMYILDDKFILTEDIFDQNFVCNLEACKGACCWEGDAGAPLEDEEIETLKAIYPLVKPYLTTEGIKVIESEGVAVEALGEWGTSLIDDGPCSFIQYDDSGKAICGIEQAYNDGVVDFKKPISCHLYPIRVKKLPDYEALNYDRWDICSAACSLGDELKVPVYRFVKDALIRKYGADFYQKIEDFAAFHEEHKDDKL